MLFKGYSNYDLLDGTLSVNHHQYRYVEHQTVYGKILFEQTTCISTVLSSYYRLLFEIQNLHYSICFKDTTEYHVLRIQTTINYLIIRVYISENSHLNVLILLLLKVFSHFETYHCFQNN